MVHFLAVNSSNNLLEESLVVNNNNLQQDSLEVNKNYLVRQDPLEEFNNKIQVQEEYSEQVNSNKQL